MRKALLLLAILFLIGATVGCKAQSREDLASTVDVSLQNREVELYLKQKTVTDETTEFAIVYVNSTDIEYTYDNTQTLEKMRDGEWYLIPDQQETAGLVLNTLAPNATMDDVFYIEEHYVKLEHGTYRIIKKFFDGDGIDVLAGATFDIQ